MGSQGPDDFYRAWAREEQSDMQVLTLKLPKTMVMAKFTHERVLKRCERVLKWPEEGWKYVESSSTEFGELVVKFKANRQVRQTVKDAGGRIFMAGQHLKFFQGGQLLA